MSSTNSLGILLTLNSILFISDCVYGYPVGQRVPMPGIEIPPPEIIGFMRRFGYLDSNPSDSEALYHEAAVIAAIRNVQKYGALEQTGKLDNATLKLLSTPRCGVPDIESGAPVGYRTKRYIVGARAWQKRKIKYYIANWSSKVGSEQIERDVRQAFEMWSRYNGLKFSRINDTSADVIIGFGSQYHGDNYPFDGPGNILAHAFYPYEMGSYGGDIHFDEDENWKENSTDLSDGVDFYSVALHEIGHSLGLAHSPVYTSVMFAYYKGPGHNILDYDDVLAMYELYVQRRLEGDDDVNTTTELLTTTTSRSINPTGRDMTTESTIPDTTTGENVVYTYEGDYETVSEHKRKHDPIIPTTIWAAPRNTTQLPTETRPSIPIVNICDGHFDAVSMIRDAVYIFKGRYVWKLTQHYTISRGYPVELQEMLPFLPGNIHRIDAVYERYDGATIYFTGNVYWVHDGTTLLENSPKPLENLLTGVSKVDAAMVWPKNNLTYIFVGEQFWRLDDRYPNNGENLPKSMNRWVGIPHHIDASATLTSGKTYFFKDNLYWLYNNKFVRPERGYPRRASTAWLRCPLTERTKLRNNNTTVLFI